MNIDRKVELAEQAIRNITTHHDAPEDDVRNACARLGKFMESELAGMGKAREAHEKRLKIERARKAANRR